jgi:hypothetical protein
MRKAGGVRQQAMTAAQVLKLKRLSEEACQHQQFQPDLGPADAERGIVASQYSSTAALRQRSQKESLYDFSPHLVGS